MRRLKILTWHTRGSYLYYLGQVPHDFYVLSQPGRPAGYTGRSGQFPWGENVHDLRFMWDRPLTDAGHRARGHRAAQPRLRSMGLAVIAAMMTGLPVVALATTEMVTVIRDDVSGHADTDVRKLIGHMHALLARSAARPPAGRGRTPPCHGSVCRRPLRRRSAGGARLARPQSERHRANQKELGVTNDHYTEDMKQKKRGTFP